MNKLTFILAAALCATGLARAEKLVIKGSDTLGAKLVPMLAEDYKSKNPGVTFEIAAEGSGSRGVLNMVPPPPVAKKDKLAEDIAKAAKPDCRTAYAGLGILAVVPLVASSVGNNGGCNW